MTEKSSKEKRKRQDSEMREFDQEWEEAYFFIQNAQGKPCCLICKSSVAAVKKYNIERHFRANHESLNETYPLGSGLRTEFLHKMKSTLKTQQGFFRKADSEAKDSIHASYEIALLLARNKKPFSDAEEIIRPAFDIIQKRILKDAFATNLQNLTLSRRTITRRCEDLARDIREQLGVAGTTCEYFTLCIDESTDMSDTSQLAIFVRAVNAEFEVIEELLHLKPLHGTTKDSDLFSALKPCTNNTWSKLESICTDGAPALVGHNLGCIALLEKFLSRSLLKYHCLIHQEALVGKTLELSHVMDVVVKCVNKIRAKALNHREFRSILVELEEQYTDLILHCNVRWLSRGKALARFWQLKNQIYEFLVQKDELIRERELLKNPRWLNDLAFFTDVTSHLNDLNLRLQGQNKLLAHIASDIVSFELKLKLFVDGKSNCPLKAAFGGLKPIPSGDELIDFWKKLPRSTFPRLRSFALRQICLFGTTSRCEQAFSSTKLIKGKQRLTLTDAHLDDLLCLASSKLQPNISELSSKLVK